MPSRPAAIDLPSSTIPSTQTILSGAKRRRGPRLCENAFVIGGAGSLSEKKGQEVLTLAFEELKKNHPTTQRLWIGTWNPKLSFADEFVDMIAAGDVIITRHVSHGQMLDHLGLLDVLILASPDE